MVLFIDKTSPTLTRVVLRAEFSFREEQKFNGRTKSAHAASHREPEWKEKWSAQLAKGTTALWRKLPVLKKEFANGAVSLVDSNIAISAGPRIRVGNCNPSERLAAYDPWLFTLFPVRIKQ